MGANGVLIDSLARLQKFGDQPSPAVLVRGADAVQDAFISAYQSLNAFAGQSALGTWLHRIVINCCLMRLRSRKRRPTLSLDSLLPKFDHSWPLRSRRVRMGRSTDRRNRQR